VVSAGTRWRDRAQARDARRGAHELRGLGTRVLFLFHRAWESVLGHCVRAGTLRGGAEVQRWAENWAKCSRGLDWSAGRGRAYSRLTPRTPALLAHLRPVIRLARPRMSAPQWPAEPARRLAGCCVAWCQWGTLEPGFVPAVHVASLVEIITSTPHTDIDWSVCTSRGPHPGLGVRASGKPRNLVSPGAFRSQLQGISRGGACHPKGRHTTERSNLSSGVCCRRDERGSYSPHLKLCWPQLWWLFPACTIPLWIWVPGSGASLEGGGMGEQWLALEAFVARVCRGIPCRQLWPRRGKGVCLLPVGGAWPGGLDCPVHAA
jgi:hypothetical protein